MNAHEVAEINERRREVRGTAEDHDVPYAPAPAAAYKLAAVIPVSSELWADADVYGGVDGMWRAYWRRREFNERRHVNPFPRFRPFRWLP